MPTDHDPSLFGFAPVEGLAVVAGFDGGAITSNAGALLLGATDRAIGLVRRFAACFRDARAPERIEHEVATLVGQRVFGIALGHEDVVDHDQLRHDPVLAILAEKLEAKRAGCAPLAGKSTLNRLEHAPVEEPGRYHRIGHDAAAVEALFVDLFLDAHRSPPRQIVLDLDATDVPLHGHQEGRFFHGYYDAYCYLPLYVFCGRHLLAAKLRRSNIDGSAGAVDEVERIVRRIRARWPRVRILLRADSGFAREPLMAWCEANRVDFVFGLARNPRLVEEIATDLAWAEDDAARTGKPARRFRDFRWSTLDSWSRRRRVIGKAEWTHGGGHHARQPAAPVVRLHGLRAALRAPAHRPRPYRVRRGHLRHHAAQAAQDRRAGPHLRPPRQNRHGLGPPIPGRVRPGPRETDCRRDGLTKQILPAAIRPANAARHPATRPHGPGKPRSISRRIAKAEALRSTINPVHQPGRW